MPNEFLPARPYRESHMSMLEVIDWARTVMLDPWYRSQMTPSYVAMSHAMGLEGSAISNLVLGRQKAASPQVLERITAGIKLIESRESIWCKGQLDTGLVGRGDRFHYQRVPRPKEIPVRVRMHTIQAFTIFAECRGCNGNKWLPAEIDGKELALCYNCLPETQYPAIGARAVKRSLIADFMKEELCRTRSFAISVIPTPVSTVVKERTIKTPRYRLYDVALAMAKK